MSWKLHPAPIRAIGSKPATSFIQVLGERLNELEQDIDLLRTRRQWLFEEAATHGYDKATVREAAASLKSIP